MNARDEALAELALEMLQDATDIPTACPHDNATSFHFWTVEGPFAVSCDNCGAEGRIVMISGPEEDE